MKSSKYQLDIEEVYVNTEKNILINAAAGSGKTTTLLNLLKRKKPFKRCIFLAFNKSISEELKKRVPFGIEVSTMHSLGARLLSKYFNGRIEIKPNKTFTYCMKFLKEWGLEKSNKKFDYINTISDLVNLYRLYFCKDEDELTELADYHGITCFNGEISRAIKVLDSLREYNSYLQDNEEKKMIDFTDMIYLPNILKDIEWPQYDEVFIDECQDLSILQQMIIRKILKPNGRFVACGDSFQAIYGFLGSDIKAFQNFQNQPNTVTLPLSISYRCAKNIINEARGVYDGIEPFSENIDGEVRRGSYKEAESGDFILCRNNQPLIEMYLEILRSGKKCYIKGKDLGEELVKLVNKVENKTTKEGLEYLSVLLSNVAEELKQGGIIKYSNHPRYVKLQEKIEIIRILSREYTSFSSLKKSLDTIFADDGHGIVLSTIHKAKGLEADNVFILREELIPSPYAEKHWEIVQERNLLYVALTRPKKRLIYINDF